MRLALDYHRAMTVRARLLDGESAEQSCEALVDLLVDAVESGASVGFLAPLSRETARHYWRGVFQRQQRGELMLFGAFAGDRLQGTVQLLLSMPENGPHRAEVAKLLVHRRARRQGVGRVLMQALERVAVEAGKRLLVLDTQTGSAAEEFYTSLGYTKAGVIPGYALLPQGGVAGTSVFWKELAG
jgi:GNAT superfamily N-acetyltransferase